MGLFDKLKKAVGNQPEPPKSSSRSRSRGGTSSGTGSGSGSGGSGSGRTRSRGGRGRGGSGGSGGGGGGRGQGSGGGGDRDSQRSGSGSGGGSSRSRSRGGRGRGGGGGSGTARRVTREGAGEATSERSERSSGERSSSGGRSRGGSGGGSGTRSRSRSGSGSGGGSGTRSRSSSSRSRSRSGGGRRERVRRGSASSGSQRRVLDANERPKEPVKKQILISASDPNEIRVAIREQQRVVEVYVERKGKRSLAGNIYKGRVQNVLPGMEAAFVDIGLERNGFLYVDEVTPAAVDSDHKMNVTMATGGDADANGNGKALAAASTEGETLTIESTAGDTTEGEDLAASHPNAYREEPATDAEVDADAGAGSETGTGAETEAAGDSAGAGDAVGADAPVASGETLDISQAIEEEEREEKQGKAKKPAGRGRSKPQQKRKIQELLSAGQEIMCQVVKDPMGTKGSRLTTQYSLAGRYLVYVPDGEGLGVSRRLEDAERERLRGIVKEFELPAGGGLIVRTAAEGARAEDIEKDLQLLLKLHEKLMEQAGGQRAPKLLYNEADLSLRIIRDLFNDEVEDVLVDDERQYQRITTYLKRTSPTLLDRVKLYDGQQPLFDAYGVEAAIKSTLNKRVNLPGGGYLIIDYAEAFTVIDVNTGRNVGKTSLEETITKTNMEAAEEIVRQLRLRDIGGIIVVDFIDMNMMKNRDAVLEHFRKELSKDRTKTYLVEISPLGLVEMTRQNVSDGVREILTSTCKVCEGRGVVIAAETHAIEVERALSELAEGLGEGVEAVAVDAAPEVQALLAGNAGRRREIEKRTGKVVRMFADPELDPNTFAVRAKGTKESVEALREPLRRGEQVKVTIEEVDPLNEADGIVRHEGTLITVVGAGGDVGEERTILIAAAEGDRAFATVVRPARRRRRRGGRGRSKAGAGAAQTAAAAAGEEAAADELEAEAEEDGEFEEGEEFEDEADDQEAAAAAAAAAAADEGDEFGSEIPQRPVMLSDESDDDADEFEDDADHDDDADDDEDADHDDEEDDGDHGDDVDGDDDDDDDGDGVDDRLDADDDDEDESPHGLVEDDDGYDEDDEEDDEPRNDTRAYADDDEESLAEIVGELGVTEDGAARFGIQDDEDVEMVTADAGRSGSGGGGGGGEGTTGAAGQRRRRRGSRGGRNRRGGRRPSDGSAGPGGGSSNGGANGGGGSHSGGGDA